jgi:hypothetical protein
MIESCEKNSAEGVDSRTSEPVWVCGRGRTRLCCDLHHRAEGSLEVQMLRNGRVYGSYRFVERLDALRFAARLHHSFKGNGWINVTA